MNAGKYWLLMFLATVIAVLIFLEIACEMQVSSLTSAVSAGEARVTQAQRQNDLLRQLIQRMAVLSQRDPALLDLLTKRGVRITGRTDSTATPPPSSAPPITTPSTPAKP